MHVSRFTRFLVRFKYAAYFVTILTMYVFVTAIFVRMIFLSDYATMIESLDFLSDNLLAGGIFAVILYFLKDGISKETVKAVKQWRGQPAAATTSQNDA